MPEPLALVDWSGTTGVAYCTLCAHASGPYITEPATDSAARDHHATAHPDLCLCGKRARIHATNECRSCYGKRRYWEAKAIADAAKAPIIIPPFDGPACACGKPVLVAKSGLCVTCYHRERRRRLKAAS